MIEIDSKVEEKTQQYLKEHCVFYSVYTMFCYIYLKKHKVIEIYPISLPKVIES